MSDQTTPTTVEHLLTEEAGDALAASGFGDWQSLIAADAVPLGFGFPDPETFPRTELTAAVEAVFEESAADVLQYDTDRYADRLEAFVAERERARGVDDDAAVTLTNGAMHAIDTISRAFLSPGDVVAVEEPTFVGALRVFRNAGAEVVGVPVDEQGLDVEAFAELLRNREQRGEALPTLLYTTPTFQNPTGTTLPRARRERLLDLAAEYDLAVLEDDAYGELWYDGEPEPPLAALDGGERVLRVGTFSKTIAPGLRLGWVIGPEQGVAAVDTLAAGGSNTFTRSVTGWYCDAGHFEAALPTLRETYERRRDRMLDSLAAEMPAGATWTEPGGGFFIWVELPDGVDADAMLEDALDDGVAYLPGSLFYAGEGPSNRLRLSFSFATPGEIETGVARLADTVRERL